MTRSIRGSRRAAALLAGAAVSGTLLLSGCGAGQIAETANMEPTISGVNVQLDTADGSYKVQNLAVSYLNTKGYPRDGEAPLQAAIYNDTAKPVTVRVSTTSARAVVLSGSPSTSSPSAGPIPSAPATATASPEASGSASASPSGSTSASASASPSGRASASPSASGSANPSASTSVSPGASAPASGSPSATPSESVPPTPSESAPAGEPATFQIPAGGYVLLNKAAGGYLQLVGLSKALAPGESVELVFDFNGQQLKTDVPVAVPLTPAPRETPVVPQEHGGEGGYED